MKVDHSGPALTADMLEEFRIRTGFELPGVYVQFLRHRFNGGYPVETYFPTADLDGEPLTYLKLHGIYGVGHPIAAYNLEEAFQERQERLRWKCFAFGFDDMNGQLVIKTNIQPRGEISDQPWGEWPESVEDSLYFVADSFESFLGSLRREP